MTVKHLMTVPVLAILSASVAQAADIVVFEDPKQIVSVPDFSWAGFYIGGQLSGFSSKTVLNYLDGEGPSSKWVELDKKLTPEPSGFAGGLYAGSNIALTSGFVLGIDTDVMWSDKKSTKTLFTDLDDKGKTVTDAYTLEQKWFGAARIRVGFAVGRIMPYIAAGAAYTQLRGIYSETVEKKDVNPQSYDLEDDKKTMIGYTLGGGLNYAMTDNIILRAEYRYSDFGKKKFSKDKIEIGYKTDDFRIGASYKF
ncbi:hemin binding protein [Bartonella australis AUST/NH1]|uniref:Hemin binding protein n=1 Tax=Bartonella australis (strain Aust/NH1) TaxID=1094489 RepID=M1PCD8_BARAA|nr:outer membrane protein [Bartonella australis]AGF74281.1 hemin binding protein [Bartonella australis AUST/NH1]